MTLKLPLSYGLVGQSKTIQHVRAMIQKVAAFDVSVLIEGESGTGKELVARAIHYNSPRKNKEFVVVNCSAFSDALLESELFGHVRGSFTGAVSDKKGLFEVADQGTFFMDEVGDMSPALQVKLLRVLQEGVFLKLGDTSPTSVDVRIIAATNRHLRTMVGDKQFREDLYYRLNVVSLALPPLRERLEDLPDLTHFICQRIAERNKCPIKSVSSEALRILKRYSWPGNVRELENELEKAHISSDGEVIDVDHLSSQLLQTKRSGSVRSSSSTLLKEKRKQMVGDLERSMIEEALLRTRGNRTKAAEILGISRQNLIKKLALLGLNM